MLIVKIHNVYSNITDVNYVMIDNGCHKITDVKS